MSRSDPIRKNYYDSVEFADTASDWLFYGGALLSVVVLMVNQKEYPTAYDAALIVFGILALSLFIVGLLSRLHLTPRAEDKRRRDFYSSACAQNLTHERTDGYYNNDFDEPFKRIAAQLLENSLFSKAIAQKMVISERIKVAVYGLIWFAFLLNRRTELGIVVAASQALFSEQVVARWFKLEWLLRRFERVFEDVYKLFQAHLPASEFNALTLEALSSYESSKASASITLSSSVFDALNPLVSKEWDGIRATLRDNAASGKASP